MTSTLLPLLVAAPLAGTGVTAFARPGTRWPIRLLVAVLAANLLAGVALVTETRDGTVLAHGVGGWVPGIAIPFVADTLAALMVTVTGLLTLVCVLFALASGTGRLRLFAPLVLALTAGVNGALLTADVFNLFVFIEVMLLPSYGLYILARQRQGDPAAVTGSRLYVTFNLFVSTVFLAGVALVYGTAGTVNLAELAGAATDSPLVAAATALCLFALAMKAAVIPTHGWLGRTYPATSPAVTALFSGLHTKVAIYAIYRIYAVVFDGDQRYLWIGVVVFSATMLVGVMAAVGADTMRSILAFHMVSQIGYILLGVALFTPAGLTAGIFYLLHHMIVKASLFLSTGAVETHYGTGRLDALRGAVRREPVLAISFGLAALSLAGLPPLSGFVAKLTLIMAAADAGQPVVVAIALVVSLVTLLSMLKIWNAVFAAPSRADGPGDPVAGGGQLLTARRTAVRTSLAVPAAVLAVVTVGLGVGGEVLLGLASAAADGLLDPTSYLEAVRR
ncbi:monovalent cation/H+ antiporter subunit D family protein [Micromonospora radicis]|uniref:Monovalent cation/H+ antiporter subunit D family protein n=1 Tax=Micromonospora radicis TaxID=1894971 RepID=A0A418MYU2_9ACTN|nr:monovalent cation/H+ antiporter subunit D family protein [Micromonospora radicis]RIV40247.1 monovalent cation/H+ antiporter subunit D family protein [Micromonospora radicis]